MQGIRLLIAKSQQSPEGAKENKFQNNDFIAIPTTALFFSFYKLNAPDPT